MCLGVLPMMKKAGVNPMFAVSPALALAGVGGKKKPAAPTGAAGGSGSAPAYGGA